MDIQITCRACDRAYPLSMVVDTEDNPGHCPFCGVSLAFQYTSTLVETASQVLHLGAEFTRQLTLLAELAGGYAIVPETITAPVEVAIATQTTALATPFEAAWPPNPASTN